MLDELLLLPLLLLLQLKLPCGCHVLSAVVDVVGGGGQGVTESLVLVLKDNVLF